MRHVIFVFATFLLLLSPCFSQDESTGAVRGIVLDPSGRRIVGATVALVNNSTAFHYQQISDGEGRFAFGLLSPGDYSARVTADKMSPQLSLFLRVTLGGVTEIQFKLQIAGPRENVTVSAEPRAVETEPRGVSAVIDERAILNLPLNAVASPTCLCSRPKRQPIRADRIRPRTATSHSAAFADSRPATWSMAATTIMLSLDKRVGDIARPTSSQMKWFRSSESRQILIRLNLAGPEARS